MRTQDGWHGVIELCRIYQLHPGNIYDEHLIKLGNIIVNHQNWDATHVHIVANNDAPPPLNKVLSSSC